MPERVRWILHYPATSEDNRNQVRLHYEGLLGDPNVADVHLEIRPEDPFSRQMRVVFEDGFSQPQTFDLRYLNLRFAQRSPTREPTQLRAVPWPLSQAEAPPTIDSGVFDMEYVKHPPQPPLEPLRAPEWVKPGAWSRHRTLAVYFHIEGLVGKPFNSIPDVVGTTEGERNKTHFALDCFIRDFLPALPRPTAWSRLLGEGEY